MSIEKPKYGLKRFCVILLFIVPAYGVHPSVILIIAEKKIIESSEDFLTASSAKRSRSYK